MKRAVCCMEMDLWSGASITAFNGGLLVTGLPPPLYRLCVFLFYFSNVHISVIINEELYARRATCEILGFFVIVIIIK